MNGFKTWVARLVRKLILRGRASAGYYSCEGYRAAPDEPEQAIVARRAGWYGMTSECPAGAEVVVLAINGGASNRVAVGEWLTDEPEIEQDEVLLWCRVGQRVLLRKDGDVVIYPKAGRKVLLGSDDGTECDSIVTRSELNAKLTTLREMINHHVHGGVTIGAGETDPPSTGLPILDVAGSPNVSAKKP